MSYTIDQLNEKWAENNDASLGVPGSRDMIDALIMDAIGKATEIARLRAALEAVEWVHGTHYVYCPWCRGTAIGGNGTHDTDCQRQSALGITTRGGI